MRTALLALVREIPAGQVCELPALARALNIPPRHAAYIMSALTAEEAALLAWYRVVPAGGRFVPEKRETPRIAEQIRRLEGEGVRVGARGMITGWPASAWTPPDTHAGTVWADEEDAS
ncbi:MAG: MGMT family protein [Hyphomonas sp.]